MCVCVCVYVYIYIALDLSRSPFFLLNLRQTQTVSSGPARAAHPRRLRSFAFFWWPGVGACSAYKHTDSLCLARLLARSHAHTEHYDYGNTTVPKDLINTMQTDVGKSKSLTQSAHSAASSLSDYTYHIPAPVAGQAHTRLTRTQYQTVDATANASHVVSSYAVPHHAGQLRAATMTVRPDSDRSLSDRVVYPVVYPPLPPFAKGASPSLSAQNWGDA